MAVTHRYNSSERQHYLLEQHYSFKLKPRLLYVGQLEKQSGWTEELHSHDFLELVFILSGKGTATIDGHTFSIRGGDILVYNAGLIHSETSSADDPFEANFLALDKLQITDLPGNWLYPPSYGYIFQTEDMYETFSNYFNILLHEFENREHLYGEISQTISQLLLMYLFRLIDRQGSTSISSQNRIMSLSKEYIDKNFRRQISLDDIAEACYCNVYYLSHLFSKEQGVSVGKYLLQRRIAEAKKLLCRTNLSVSQVGVAVGIPDASYFNRVFKAECGTTPLKYKKEHTRPKK